jgi:hypothetical protein
MSLLEFVRSTTAEFRWAECGQVLAPPWSSSRSQLLPRIQSLFAQEQAGTFELFFIISPSQSILPPISLIGEYNSTWRPKPTFDRLWVPVRRPL